MERYQNNEWQICQSNYDDTQKHLNNMFFDPPQGTTTSKEEEGKDKEEINHLTVFKQLLILSLLPLQKKYGINKIKIGMAAIIIPMSLLLRELTIIR